VQVSNEADAAASLRSNGTDLVIADWPLAGKLLETMRAEDVRAPVIVFARGTPDVDRRSAMSLGATDVLTEWGDLFREIARGVLDPADAAT
jgi:DNA-binding response OmpR family regulator